MRDVYPKQAIESPGLVRILKFGNLRICLQIVESADLVVCCGTIWTDYSTVGYSLLLRPDRMINVGFLSWTATFFSHCREHVCPHWLASLPFHHRPDRSWTAHHEQHNVTEITDQTGPEQLTTDCLTLHSGAQVLLWGDAAISLKCYFSNKSRSFALATLFHNRSCKIEVFALLA